MKLTLIISSLAMGGAERVITHLASGWASQGIEVHLITLANQDPDFYILPATVGRICLGLMKNSGNHLQAIRNNLNRIKALRKQLKRLKPDAVVSFMDATNVLAVLASLGLGVATIISERTNPGKYQAHLGPAWNALRKITYPKAAAVVAVSNATASHLEPLLPRCLIEVIPNPVFTQKQISWTAPEPVQRTVVSMGRLVPLKNFDLLIRAFAVCLFEHPGWQLTIVGDGPQRKELEALIDDLGVGSSVRLMGAVKEPGPILAQADIFALCSSLEGFSNSLAEAMASGLPVVCTNEAGGEIVSNGEQGLLVPEGDLDALTHSLGIFMKDQALREQMGREARKTVEKYTLSTVINKWNLLLSRVTSMDWPIIT
jgi:GalNAc-alpha-(1->4)-GalNAc-alpha-(1->3)-diNAcBac-PP-undecaprenol alpha-1,4-N-acetyl-D-galactosaminyltransferase